MKIRKVLTNHYEKRRLLVKSLFKEMGFKFLFKDIHRFRQPDVLITNITSWFNFCATLIFAPRLYISIKLISSLAHNSLFHVYGCMLVITIRNWDWENSTVLRALRLLNRQTSLELEWVITSYYRCLAKSPLALGYVWIITPHSNMWM